MRLRETRNKITGKEAYEESKKSYENYLDEVAKFVKLRKETIELGIRTIWLKHGKELKKLYKKSIADYHSNIENYIKDAPFYRAISSSNENRNINNLVFFKELFLKYMFMKQAQRRCLFGCNELVSKNLADNLEQGPLGNQE